ncbi:MAG: alpha/beta hydrolase [Anaerolineaceae bacterium]|nr:alpha/beta hydrolase [Anaerolineaceae bacterium]
MNQNNKKSSAKGSKLLGGFALAAMASGYMYYKLNNLPSVHLPKAIESDMGHFASDVAGELYYYANKRPGGRPLLLLHSINAAPSSMEVRPLFDHYQKERPVYSLDLPGFGFSERSGERPYLPELYTQAIIEMVSTQIGTAVDAIALSLTSEFLARAAMQRPDLFNSITLVSPTGFQEGQSEKEYPGENLYRFFSLPLFSQGVYTLLTKRPIIQYYSNMSFVGDAAPQFVDYAYATSHQRGARFAPLYFLSTQLFSFDILPSVYAKLSTPALVLYDEDPNVTFENLSGFVASQSNWRAERVTPSRGLPHWEMLGEVTAVLDNFWNSISQ